jgi:hypothetical protein
MEFGGEKKNIAVLEEMAEKLRAEGYTVALTKDYRELEGYVNECSVEIVIRARKNLPVI